MLDLRESCNKFTGGNIMDMIYTILGAAFIVAGIGYAVWDEFFNKK